MNDILKLLEQEGGQLFLDAADEILRLRQEVQSYRNVLCGTSDEIDVLIAERDRLLESLHIADTACRSYWGWEYGRPGDEDDDEIPDSSLLVKWRHDYVKRK